VRHVVIGRGEIGSALVRLLGADWVDLDAKTAAGRYDHMHVAIPYGDRFVADVEKYRKQFEPSLVIVHSTVPVGTCEKIGAVHSPCRGVHPNLYAGLRTFIKFFGGEGAEKAAEPFRIRGVRCYIAKTSRDTEAMKLWETTQYGVFIRLMQEIHDYCEANGLDFETVYRLSNISYNDGYAALGLAKFNRPVLEYMGPGIGGHCVRENARLLDSPFAQLVIGEPVEWPVKSVA
jgi:hypothetical protein